MKCPLVMLILFVACGLVHSFDGFEDASQWKGDLPRQTWISLMEAEATAEDSPSAAPDTAPAVEDDVQQTAMSGIVKHAIVKKASAQWGTGIQPVATHQGTTAQNVTDNQIGASVTIENSEATLTAPSEITTQSNYPIETPSTTIYVNEPTVRKTEPSPGTTERDYETTQEPDVRTINLHDKQEGIQDTTMTGEPAVTSWKDSGFLIGRIQERAEQYIPELTEDLERLSQTTEEPPTTELAGLSQTTEAPPTTAEAQDTEAATTDEIIAVTPGPSRGRTVTSTAQSFHSACNTTEDCPFYEICIVVEGGCECTTETSDNSNIALCDAVHANENVTEETVATEGAWPTQKILRTWSNLTLHDKRHSVTSLKFCPEVEIVEWFQSYDDRFRTFVAATFTNMSCIVWNGSCQHFTAEHIMYVAPSPLNDGGMTLISIVMQRPSNHSHDDFLPNNQVLTFLKEKQVALEVQLQLKVCVIIPGFPSDLLPDNSTAGNSSHIFEELTITEVSILVTILIIVIVGAVVAIAFLVRKRRQSGKVVFEHPINMPYRFPRAIFRSSGDGHNLATDEQCQLGEDGGQQRTPPATEENGACSLMTDANVWVVPYEEFSRAPGQTGGGGDDDGGATQGATQHKDDVPVSVDDTKV